MILGYCFESTKYIDKKDQLILLVSPFDPCPRTAGLLNIDLHHVRISSN